MEGITISFVLPWFHRLELFKQALAFNQRIFSQPGCEVVISMDEPSEEKELVKYVFAGLPAIKWRVVVNDKPHPWRPPCKAINVGIRQSYGDWIAVLSPETVIELPEPDFLMKLAGNENKCFYTGHLRFVKQLNMSEPFVPTDLFGYGFILCPKSWMQRVSGYAENRKHWGGDDDDIQARLRETCGDKLTLSTIHLTHPEHGNTWAYAHKVREPIGDQMPRYAWGRDFYRVALDWAATNTVFDGSYRCKVPWCCEGKVLQVTVYEAPAFPNLIRESLLTDKHFICQDCRKELPYVRELERK